MKTTFRVGLPWKRLLAADKPPASVEVNEMASTDAASIDRAKLPSECDDSSLAPTLLVIAHPDDEAMFFGPLLLHLRQEFMPVHILCLSNGNYEGLGHLRETELIASARCLGIPASFIHIVKHYSLQDGMHNIWPIDVVAKVVSEHMMSIQPQLLVTFDNYGVSGHPNHIAVSKGVAIAHQEAVAKDGNSGSLKLIVLESVTLWRKFIGALDFCCVILLSLLSVVLNSMQSFSNDAPSLSPTLAVVNANLLTIVTAMAAHTSQFVWYRKLFVLFSRYSYVNTFKEVQLP